MNQETLELAIQGLEFQRAKLTDQIGQLRERLTSSGGRKYSTDQQEQPVKKKRKMSAAGRRRIAEATRKRWADLKKRNAKAGK